MKNCSVFVLGTLWIAVAGCALNEQGDREVSEILAQHEQMRSQEARRYAASGRLLHVSTTAPATRPTGLMPLPTTLQEYLCIALAELERSIADLEQEVGQSLSEVKG